MKNIYDPIPAGDEQEPDYIPGEPLAGFQINALCPVLIDLRPCLFHAERTDSGHFTLREERSMNTIIIEVSGGTAEVTQAPPGTRIILWDWDNFNATNPNEDGSDGYEPQDFVSNGFTRQSNPNNELTNYIQVAL